MCFHAFSHSSNGGSGFRAGRKHNLFKFPPRDEAENTVPTGGEGVGADAVYINGQPVPAQYLQADGDTFTLDDGEYTFTNPYDVKVTSSGHRVKTFSFPAIRVGSPAEIEKENQPYIPNIRLEKPAVPVMIFPTRTGTGDLRLDPAELLSTAAGGRPQSKPFRFVGADGPDSSGSGPYGGQNGGQNGSQNGGQYGGQYGGHRTGHAFRFPGLEADDYSVVRSR